MSKNISASIVIPTLNEERYVGCLLESLSAVKESVDIIVVDGNSSDKTEQVVRSYQDRFRGASSLRFISSERGISSQRNAGALISKHEILLFIDADVVIPTPEAYSALLNDFTRSEYAIAMPHLIPREPGLRARCIYAFFAVGIWAFVKLGKPYFPGSCLLTKKSVFLKVGGFNVGMPVAEDLEYSLKTVAIGPAGFLPTRILVSARRFIMYGYWNTFWLYVKEGFVVAIMGRIDYKEADYPFGEYGKI